VLADELLFGKLVHGGKVTIDVDEGEKVVLRFETPAPAVPPAAAEPVA
jgi:ATP-dependent Clp protease ATP-binding subunit ClpA